MHESINDALIACVRACGGSKVVGVAIWPAKGVEAAQRHLLACLNPERNEKLGPEEMVMILRMARDRGFHDGMQHLSHALSYAEPVPIEPKDELSDLLRQYLQSREQDQSRNERLQRLIADHLKARAVA